MEDLITIVIIIAGVLIKIFSSVKKRDPEPEREETPPPSSWDEFLEEVDKSPEMQEAIDSDPELQYALEQARQQQAAHEAALRQAQAERDAALLENQRVIAEMAAKAQAANQSSLSEENSAIYAENCDDDTAENAPDPGSWAELIRNNRTEALVISEILAPPAALR